MNICYESNLAIEFCHKRNFQFLACVQKSAFENVAVLISWGMILIAFVVDPPGFQDITRWPIGQTNISKSPLCLWAHAWVKAACENWKKWRKILRIGVLETSVMWCSSNNIKPRCMGQDTVASWVDCPDFSDQGWLLLLGEGELGEKLMYSILKWEHKVRLIWSLTRIGSYLCPNHVFNVSNQSLEKVARP